MCLLENVQNYGLLLLHNNNMKSKSIYTVGTVLKSNIKIVERIRVITKLPNTEQSYKGKVKTHNYINRQNQSTTGKLWKRNDPDLVQAFLKQWWVESDFKAPNLPLPRGIVIKFCAQTGCVQPKRPEQM